MSSFPEHIVLPLPALSPTMVSGTIAAWQKAEGDTIDAGDVICEVETDKAVVDYEATDDGVLAKILFPGGSADLAVGTAIAVIVEDEADVAAFASFTVADATGAAPEAAPEAAAPPPPPPAAAPPASAPPAAAAVGTALESLPDFERLPMPALSPTMAEGTVATWMKKEGDAIDAGDVICEIETDKAVVDFEAQDEGYLAKILVAQGDSVAVGVTIGLTVEDADDVAAFASFVDGAEVAEPAVEAPPAAVVAPAPVEVAPPAAAVAPAAVLAPVIDPADMDSVEEAAQWRAHVRKSPLGGLMAKAQQDYIDEYGFGGIEPL